VDTLDSWYCTQVYKICESVLQAGETIMITVISKSGTTTETIANAQLFVGLLAEYDTSYQEYVVVITDEGSPLWHVAQKEGISCLDVPKLVGGRYSVFSAVGLFPLGMIGLDLVALRDGAQSMKELCSDFSIMNNPAAMSAAILYEQYRAGYVIHDTFLFSRSLHGLAGWYRQLVAESLGKSDDRQGKRVNVGITPTVSVGPEDLHSVAQLYLGGPYNRITTFLSVPQEDALTITIDNPFDTLVPMIRGKSFVEIIDAIERGTHQAYEHDMRPFMRIELPELSAYTIGQFMQLKMIETMYLGFLFDIDPFDQPQVELYKKETREILDHE
jgi:glucose-6-phosphate isomerase